MPGTRHRHALHFQAMVAIEVSAGGPEVLHRIAVRHGLDSAEIRRWQKQLQVATARLLRRAADLATP